MKNVSAAETKKSSEDAYITNLGRLVVGEYLYNNQAILDKYPYVSANISRGKNETEVKVRIVLEDEKGNKKYDTITYSTDGNDAIPERVIHTPIGGRSNGT